MLQLSKITSTKYHSHQLRENKLNREPIGRDTLKKLKDIASVTLNIQILYQAVRDKKILELQGLMISFRRLISILFSKLCRELSR